VYKGIVKLSAALTDNTIKFQPYTFIPPIAGVDRIELEASDGERILASVEVCGVASTDDGCALARTAFEASLNRLSYFHQVNVGRARVIDKTFTSLQPGTVVITATIVAQGQQPKLIAGLSANELKAALEPAAHPGEHNFGALRSARLSVGSVEEYMHLYAILLELFGDSQNDVDTFIRTVEPNVAQSQHPKKAAGVMETVYTRLRNELAHRRPGVETEQTKKEMAIKVGDLRGVVKEAIRQNP
jgi:hypothetical protein